MQPVFQRVSVGDVVCTVLGDDAKAWGADRLRKYFPQVTADEARQAYAQMGLAVEESAISYNPLVLQMKGDTVLVDSGEAHRPEGAWLMDNLRAAAIAPEDITLVVISHSHTDHIQGLLTPEGQAAFPNARYVLARAELPYWQMRIETTMPHFRPIYEMVSARGLYLIEMDEMILPGLTAVPLPGHTPGQIGLRVESAGAVLYALADALHTPMQFAHPEWSISFDADPALAAQTRRSALAQAAAEGALVSLYHLAFPGLGHVRQAGESFVWETLSA